MSMALLDYGTVMRISWLVFLIVWGIGSFNVKRDAGGKVSWWHRCWLGRVALIVLVTFVLLHMERGATHKSIGAILFRGPFTPGEPVGWIAATLTALGIAFAISARIHLGRNWSSAPTAKEGHELVTSGPYRLVRHPIYTGLILAVFGSALLGSSFGIGIFIIVAVLFYRRIDKEERIMLELFPAAYPPYQATTKKLIPWVY